MTRYKYKKKGNFGIRTVRSCTSSIPPILNKDFIGFQVDDVDSNTDNYNDYDNNRIIKTGPAVKELTTKWLNPYLPVQILDGSIYGILRRFEHNDDALLVITPSNQNKHQYKVHVINKRNKRYLGVIIIKQEELITFQNSKAYQTFCTMICSKYIDVRSVITQGIHLVNMLNNSCCLTSSLHRRVKSIYKRNPYTKNSLYSNIAHYDNNNDTESDRNRMAILKIAKRPSPCTASTQTESKQIENKYTQADASQTIIEQKTNSNVEMTEDEIRKFMKELNNLPNIDANEAHRFFHIAEQYKFHLIIRPQLLCTNLPKLCVHDETGDICHFLLECFIPNNNDNNMKYKYLDRIIVEHEILKIALANHGNLCRNIEIIDDVFEMIPRMPRFLKRVVYYVLTLCKLHLIYDILGEIVYDVYRKFYKSL